MEYLYENGHIITRSQFQSVVAAAEYFFPMLRRELAWCHQVIDGWNVDAVSHHTVPLGKRISQLVAMHMSSLGYARLGVGCVLQAHTGLRPGELLAITSKGLLFSEDQGRHLKDMPASSTHARPGATAGDVLVTAPAAPPSPKEIVPESGRRPSAVASY